MVNRMNIESLLNKRNATNINIDKLSIQYFDLFNEKIFDSDCGTDNPKGTDCDYGDGFYKEVAI